MICEMCSGREKICVGDRAGRGARKRSWSVDAWSSVEYVAVDASVCPQGLMDAIALAIAMFATLRAGSSALNFKVIVSLKPTTQIL